MAAIVNVDGSGQVQQVTRRPSLLRFVVDHNPLFLLSGVSMLLGCYLINAAVHEEQARSGGLGSGLGVLLGLLAVFNLYEVLVVGLGVYLLRSRGLVRDAGFLLVVEVLLLVDVGLVYNEVATQDFTLGLAVAIALGGLAVVKVGAIAWGAGLRLSRAAWAVIVADLAAVLATPLVPRGLAIGSQWDLLPEGTFLWLYWLAGLLIAAHALPAVWIARRGARRLASLRKVLVLALVGAPVLSVLGHLWGATWVYEHPLHASYLAPVLLGGLAVFVRLAPGRVPTAAAQAVVAVGGVAALLLSLGFPESLVGAIGPIALSPLRLGLLATAAVWTAAWWRFGGAWLVVGSAGAVLVAMLGATPRIVGDRLAGGARRLGDLLELFGSMASTAADTGGRAVPSTTLGWGVAAIAMAFALLVAGGCVSLLKRPRRAG